MIDPVFYQSKMVLLSLFVAIMVFAKDFFCLKRKSETRGLLKNLGITPHPGCWLVTRVPLHFLYIGNPDI